MSIFKHKKVESNTTFDRFIEVYSIVKGKMANNMPMMTAEEEFMEDVISDAIELFGNSFVFGENK